MEEFKEESRIVEETKQEMTVEKRDPFIEKVEQTEDELKQKCKEYTGKDEHYIHLFGLGIFYYNIGSIKLAIDTLKTCATNYHYAPASYYLGKIHVPYHYDESREYFTQAYKDYHDDKYTSVHKLYDENCHYIRYKFDQLKYLTK